MTFVYCNFLTKRFKCLASPVIAMTCGHLKKPTNHFYNGEYESKISKFPVHNLLYLNE